MRNYTRDPSDALRDSGCCVQCKDGGICGKSVDERAPFPICPEHIMALLRAYRPEPMPIEELRERHAMRRMEWGHDTEVENRRRDAEAKRRAALKAQELVYYVRLPGDRIKIGTTTNLTQRLNGLRVTQAAVLATEPGGYEKEAMRHREFAHLRLDRLEDFGPADDLMAHIEQVRQMWGEPTITTNPSVTP